MKQHIETLGGNDIKMNGDVYEHSKHASLFNRNSSGQPKNNQKGISETVVEDLEDSMPGVIPTISNQVSSHVAMTNGNLGGKHTQQRAANGHIPNGRPNFRSMLEDAELDSHI